MATTFVKQSTISLPIGGCYFLNFPNNHEDCEVGKKGGKVFCYYCQYIGKFIGGDENLDDYNKPGHIACLVIFGMITVLGLFGAFANCLIIAVLKKRKSKKAFDTFLTSLACYDFVCSVFTIIGAAASVIYFQNWSRGRLPLYLYYIGTFTSLLGRSGSSFMTVLISFERYVVIAFPMKTLNWFDLRRTRILAVCSLLFSLVMAFPRYSSVYIGHNEFGKNINATKSLEYLLLSTPLEKFFYVTLKGYFNHIDFWAPLPLLLLFNGLIFYHIFRYKNSEASLMNVNQRNEIRTVAIFIPVVGVLFLCNIVPIVLNYFLLKGIYYRELGMGVGLSYVINSAVNLPIYYLGGARFRKETKTVLVASFPGVAAFLGMRDNGTAQSQPAHVESNSDRC